MKIFKIIQLLVIALSLTLTACGGGGSSADNQGSAAPLSFKATANTLFGFDENSEPMDMSIVTVNSDADDDETAFDELLNKITTE